MRNIRLITVVFLVALGLMISGTMAFTGGPIPKYPGVTVQVLVKGAPIHGANGLYFGPDGNLYVASVCGNEIIKMDPHSGRILDRIGQEHGVISPDDLVFGPDGSLYWTAIGAGDTGKLAPDGSHSTIVNLGPGVNPITFSPDNQWLYVAKDFLGKGLFKVRPDGSEPTALLPDLVNLNAFDFGPDGWLYGPIYAQKVIRINVDTLFIEDVITGIAPSAVKFDLQGRLYTNDNNTGEVFRYDLGTKCLQVLATLPFSMDNLAIDSLNHVYVSSDADGYIAKILPNGNYVILSPGGMIFPSGVAVLQRPDGGESVYVGDMWSLREFDGRTGKVRSVEPAGAVSLDLRGFPFSLAPDGGNLLVASTLNSVIQEYDPINHTVLANYTGPIFPGVPFMPVNAIRFNGDIVATDFPTGLVVRRISGSWNPIFSSCVRPVGLAANGSDLWVTDYAQGKVFKIGSSDPVAVNLDGPEGLAYYPPDGSLLVVEANAGRLSKINPTTGAKIILADGLELGNKFLPAVPSIDGVAVGPSGAIYVTGNKANVLYRIEINR